MSGISNGRRLNNSLTAHEVRHTRFWDFCCAFFLFVNVVLQLLGGCAISSLSLWHAMTLYDLTRFTFTNYAYLAWH